MSPAEPSQVTVLLRAWSDGQPEALDQLTVVVYNELRRLASRYMRQERRETTLQTTALVNEAWLRLIDTKTMDWQHRAHFFAVSAQIMRRILVDAARTRQSIKRGGQARPSEHSQAFDLDAIPDLSCSRDDELMAIDEALSALAAADPRKARVVELKFFAGLSVEETAEVLKISVPTAVRDWKFARAWLLRELQSHRCAGGGSRRQERSADRHQAARCAVNPRVNQITPVR